MTCPACSSSVELCDCSSEMIKSLEGGLRFIVERSKYRRQAGVDQLKEMIKLKAAVSMVEGYWFIERGPKQWKYWPRRQKWQPVGANFMRRGFESLLVEVRKESP